MANILPIRSQIEIDSIINNSLHALASLGLEIANEEKQGYDSQNVEHRDKIFRLILLRIYLFNILDSNGDVKLFYTASVNEAKFNKILDGLVNLSKGFDGPAIPRIASNNNTIQWFPSGAQTIIGPTSGGGNATPGGTAFQNLSVNSPSTLIDTFDASLSQFVFYIVSLRGSNVGEGSRTSILSGSWRGSGIDFNEYKTPDVGGITTPITLRIEMVAGQIQLNAYASTDNWQIQGLRILFNNISFQNAQAPVPMGGTTNQVLAKASNVDYALKWMTLTVASLTDLLATVTELNYSQGVTSAIQAQINSITSNYALASALNNYLLLAGGTMSGDIAMGSHRITGLAAAVSNGQALRYEQVVGLYLLLAGGTMSGNIAMGGNKVTGLAAAGGNGDAVRYEQLINQYLLLTGGTLSGALAMGNHKITGLAAATSNGDAVRFEQLPTDFLTSKYPNSATSFDDITTPGNFVIDASGPNVNNPTGGALGSNQYVFVAVGLLDNGSVVYQQATVLGDFSFSTRGNVYFRYTIGPSWSSWILVSNGVH